MVEDAAHDDGVVRGIVVAEPVAGGVAAPGHPGSSEQAVEESGVQIVEDVFQIVGSALRAFDSLTATHLAHQVSFSGNVLPGNIPAIASCVSSLDRPAVHFGQQNVSDCLQHRVWSAFQQVGKANKQLSLAQADRVVDVYKGEEFDREFGHRGARAQLPIGFLEDVKESFRHVCARLARPKS